ncbi:CLUMA_CG005295, isoform A [Clunio marinus]|uniref:CLUMA_CG005295, isoform A n=1 Tax=Clunio marinus TaxID=568069 RepID=A0A1J1HUG0_9DIPT|nr:CLUMA_CG005295, isoform A [Clunio marinus]
MSSGAPAEPPSRPMKFPYTFSAKIAQFPLKWHVQNSWIWRYYLIGLVVSLPVFYKIDRMANSPENVAKWAESKRKEHAEHH